MKSRCQNGDSQTVSVSQYSAKLDEIHIVVDGKAMCDKPMLAHNYLQIQKGWSEDDRKELLKFHPRMICEECLEKLGEELYDLKLLTI